MSKDANKNGTQKISSGFDTEDEMIFSSTRGVFKRDIDKIIFSRAFKRLANKAHVHLLRENDSTRSRLTHSLECMRIGQHLTSLFLDQLKDLKVLKDSTKKYLIDCEVLKKENDVVKINLEKVDWIDSVGAACLIHDIGNPPFGHPAEDAMCVWWKEFKEKNKKMYDMKNDKFQEFGKFDGNALGIGIVKDKIVGLTTLTLVIFMKYPQGIGYKKLLKKKDGKEKVGFYKIDEDFVMKLYDHHFKELTIEKGILYKRHVMTYILEAADDISYCVGDIEDAWKKGILQNSEMIHIFGVFEKEIKKFKNDRCVDISTRYEKVKKKIESYENEMLEKGKEKIINQEFLDKINKGKSCISSNLVKNWASCSIKFLMFQCAEMFFKVNGEHNEDGKHDELLKNSNYLKFLSKVGHEFVYTSYANAQKQVRGYQIVQSLMDLFVNGILDSQKYGKILLKTLPQEEIRKIKKLWRKKKEESFEKADYLWEVIHIVASYVAGMTDNHAVKLYEKYF